MEQTPSTPQSIEQSPLTALTSAPTVSTSSLPTSAAAAATTSAPPPQNLNQSKPSTALQSATSQARPSFNTRPWQQPTSPYPHFSLPSPPLITSSSTPTSSIAAPPPSFGGMTGGPASHPSTSTPSSGSFSSTTPYSQQSQVRQPVQAFQSIAMTGALGTAASVRPAMTSSASQPRPSQSSPSSQSPAAQNIQGHGLLRVSSLGSPSNSQSPQLQNQPWLSSGAQGKPPLPSPSIRPQASPQPFQQRSHIPPQHLHNAPATLQKQSISSIQRAPQPSASGQQEHQSQQFPPSRIQQPSPQQQHTVRGPGLGSQRAPIITSHSGGVQLGILQKAALAETEESSTRILSKRSIQDLVNQIDPSEKLDPEVEEILVDIAEDFVESITTFGCSLAKHRKSSILEAKDILLHLERNYNMTLPGFCGDDIRIYKKPFVSDIHRERLAAIKKSITASDTATKHPGNQSGGIGKGHVSKGPGLIIGSPPKPKTREAV